MVLRTLVRSPSRLVRGRIAALRNRAVPAREHIRYGLQLLSNLLDLGTLDEDDRKDVRAAMGRLWTALREMERGNP